MTNLFMEKIIFLFKSNSLFCFLFRNRQITQERPTLHASLDQGDAVLNLQHAPLFIKNNSNKWKVKIGPTNALSSDFITNLPRFHFNKEVVVDTGNISSFDEDLTLGTDAKGDGTRKGSLPALTVKRLTGDVGIGTTTPKAKLHVAGSIRGNETAGSLRVQTDFGYIGIGPINASLAHFYTDRPKYFFNKEVIIDSGNIGSYRQQNLTLSTNNAAKVTIEDATGNVGIGTATPTAKLDVAGTVRIQPQNMVAPDSLCSQSNAGEIRYEEINGNSSVKMCALIGGAYRWVYLNYSTIQPQSPGLPPADYDSGWFFANRGKNYDMKHNLDSQPRMAVMWAAANSSGKDMYMIDSIYTGVNQNSYGSWLQRITNDSYRVSTGRTSSMSAYGVDHHYTWDDGTGYIRIYMWK